MDVTWKTNVWKNEYRLFRGKLIVGLLKKNAWNRGAYGEFNGALLRFKPAGFWQTNTIIRDIEDQRTLGTIEYNLVNGSAVIQYDQQTYSWKFDNWTRRHWTVKNEADSAQFHTNIWQSKGQIQIDYLPAAVVLAGLYTQRQFTAFLGR